MDNPNADLIAASLYDLTGMTAVVTGGGTGIGLMARPQITRALVANGAKVYITGRRLEVLQTVADQYGRGGNIIPTQLDVTVKENVLRVAQEIDAKEPNGIHVLVNNAGILKEKETTDWVLHGEPDFKSPAAVSEYLLKSTPESWAATFETNVTAIFFTSAAFVPLLAKGTASKPGYSASIVNVGSNAGINRDPWPGYFAYNASKAATQHLSRLLGVTLSQTQIRVNAIAPGLFRSEMINGQQHLLDAPKAAPAGRLGEEQDIANAVLSLVGPASTYTYGQTLYPDGGVVLVRPANIV